MKEQIGISDGAEFFYGSDDEWTWAQTLGGQLGIVRYGSVGAFNPTGIQLDIVGSAQLRSDGSDPYVWNGLNGQALKTIVIGQ